MTIPNTLTGPSVLLEQTSVKEGDQQLLSAITTEFKAGGWHAILGPNGGGKSTLLKAILGLTPHQGSITIQWPTAEPNTQSQGRLGYLPQSMPFDASLPISVRDYLLMSLSKKPIWFSRKIPVEVEVALNQVQLNDKLDRKVGDLSGGERQRLMLATALLQAPTLLILDEPMTGLDQQGQKDVLNLLSEFNTAGGTILMVEHNWQIVKQHCDQVYWIDKGLEYQGTPDDFFASKVSQSNPLQPEFME